MESVIQVTNKDTNQTIDFPLSALSDIMKDYREGYSAGYRSSATRTLAVTLISTAVAAGVTYGTFKFLKWQEELNRKTPTNE